MIIGSDRDSGKLCIEPAQPRERLRVLEGGARIHYDHVVKCSARSGSEKKMARKRGWPGRAQQHGLCDKLESWYSSRPGGGPLGQAVPRSWRSWLALSGCRSLENSGKNMATIYQSFR